MTTHSVTFSGTVQDLADFCTQLGYTGTFNDQAETQLQFFDRMVKAYVNGIVTNYRTQAAYQSISITSPTF